MKFVKKLLLIIVIGVCVSLSIFVLFGYLNYKQVTSETTLEEMVHEIQNKDSYVQLDEVANDFEEAIVAIEDRRFYTHSGIDLQSIVRVTIANLQAESIVGGGSTITQQLAKNMYFDHSQSFFRKVSEAFVALELESKYDKEEILELYINIIYYGDDYYGVGEASEGYFGKSANELTLFESSLLAGLPQAPSVYALSTHYESAQKRQVEVLNAMLEMNYISNEQYIQVLEEMD